MTTGHDGARVRAETDDVTGTPGDVLVTSQLGARRPRSAAYETEARALRLLVQALADDPSGLFQKTADLIVDVCRADSAGVTVVEPDGAEMRWHAVSGAFAANVKATVPWHPRSRDVMGQHRVLLFTDPAGLFPELRDVDPPFYESLVASWDIGGRPVGMLWAIAHNPNRHFDAEDARLLSVLAPFAAAAWQAAHAHSAALARSEEKYQSLFASIDEGFVVAALLYDDAGRAVDLVVLETNPNFDRMMQTTNAVGKRALELFPDAEASWFEAYAHVVETGESLRFENYLRPLDRWFDLYISRIGDDTSRRFAIVFNDITERKRTESELRQSQERLRVVIDSVQDYAIFTLDCEGRVTSWNEGAHRIRGYTAGEILGTPVAQFYLPADIAARMPEEEMRQAATTGRSEAEGWRIRKDGSLLWANEIMTPLRSSDSTHIGFTVISRDLTERRNAVERLRASEERLRLVVESAFDFAIFTTDVDGRIVSWNVGAERMFGWTEREALGTHMRIVSTSEDIESGVAETEMREAQEAGRAADERWHVTKDGRRFFSSGVLVPLKADGVLTGFAKIARDLTERKQLESAQRDAHEKLEHRVRARTSELAYANARLEAEVVERRDAEDQVNRLFRRVVAVQEEERRRIARDLHDQLGQPMTALRMGLQSIEATTLAENGKAQLARVQQLAEEVDQSIDFLTWDLRPGALDHIGLPAALANLASGWSERFGIPVEFSSSWPDTVRFSAESEAHLYRLTQEALHNVQKHARATHVSVLLEVHQQKAVLIIEDDGRGFNPDEHREGNGLGLISMRERAILAGGELTIDTTPGHGTTIFVRVPFGSKSPVDVS